MYEKRGGQTTWSKLMKGHTKPSLIEESGLNFNSLYILAIKTIVGRLVTSIVIALVNKTWRPNLGSCLQSCWDDVWLVQSISVLRIKTELVSSTSKFVHSFLKLIDAVEDIQYEAEQRGVYSVHLFSLWWGSVAPPPLQQ